MSPDERGAEVHTCPHCRAAVPPESRFCNRCGYGLPEGQSANARTRPFAQAERPTAEAERTSSPFSTPREWGALARAGGASELRQSETAPLERPAGGVRPRRVRRWGEMVLVAILSLGAGVGGAQLYHHYYAPAGQVEIDGEWHEEFIQIGGTRFQYADGAHVYETAPDSDVAKAGLKRGDVIIRVDGRKVRYMEDFGEILGNAPVGKPLEIIYIREGKRAWTTLTPTTNWDHLTDPPDSQQKIQRANYTGPAAN